MAVINTEDLLTNPKETSTTTTSTTSTVVDDSSSDILSSAAKNTITSTEDSDYDSITDEDSELTVPDGIGTGAGYGQADEYGNFEEDYIIALYGEVRANEIFAEQDEINSTIDSLMSQIDSVNTEYESAAQDAYINQKMEEKAIEENLALVGHSTTGTGDKLRDAIGENYDENILLAEANKTSDIDTLNTAIGDLEEAYDGLTSGVTDSFKEQYASEQLSEYIARVTKSNIESYLEDYLDTLNKSNNSSSIIATNDDGFLDALLGDVQEKTSSIGTQNSIDTASAVTSSNTSSNSGGSNSSSYGSSSSSSSANNLTSGEDIGTSTSDYTSTTTTNSSDYGLPVDSDGNSISTGNTNDDEKYSILKESCAKMIADEDIVDYYGALDVMLVNFSTEEAVRLLASDIGIPSNVVDLWLGIRATTGFGEEVSGWR